MMIQFVQAELLKGVLKKLKPVRATSNPLGSALDYVLVEQVEQHLTQLTRKEVDPQGYVRVRLAHDPTDRRQGGPPGQKYLVLYEHLEGRVERLRGPIALYLAPRTKMPCLGEWEGQKVVQQIPLKAYPGPVSDFEAIPTPPMPPGSLTVPLSRWLAAMRTLRQFQGGEGQDASGESHPLLIYPEGRVVGFHKGLTQVMLRVALQDNAGWGEAYGFPAAFVKRLCRAANDPVLCGFSGDWFGLASPSLELVSRRRPVPRYIEAVAGPSFWAQLETVCVRHLPLEASLQRLYTVSPDGLDSPGVCWVERDGCLYSYPERSYLGDTYAALPILPHVENQGEWLPVCGMHSYLTQAVHALYLHTRELKLSQDRVPPLRVAVCTGNSRYFLHLQAGAAEVWVQVVTASQNLDNLDVDE